MTLKLLYPLLLLCCLALAGWGLALCSAPRAVRGTPCGCARQCECGGDPCPCRETAKPCCGGCTCVTDADEP